MMWHSPRNTTDMILNSLTASGPISYSTNETFYHVFIPVLGWIADPLWTRGGMNVYAAEQPNAFIFSREGALSTAKALDGRAYRVTRTGKLQQIGTK